MHPRDKTLRVSCENRSLRFFHPVGLSVLHSTFPKRSEENMETAGGGSRRCRRSFQAKFFALATLSVIARGSAFVGIGRPRPMAVANLKHRVSSRTAARVSPIDARASSRATPQMAAGGAGEEELGFVEKITTAWGTVIEQVISDAGLTECFHTMWWRRGRHMHIFSPRAVSINTNDFTPTCAPENVLVHGVLEYGIGGVHSCHLK